MNVELFAAFCLAATLVVLMPGPIVTLVIANSIGHGTRTGLTTAAAATVGNGILVGVAAAGLTTIMAVLSGLFDVIRIAGAVYLIWLGVRAWRARNGDDALSLPEQRPRRTGAVFLQGLIVALTNPKAILFYVAFLPQFIDPTLPAGPQLVALCVAMVTIGFLFDSGYALLAGRVRGWFADPARRIWQNRVMGSLLVATGIGLLLARRA